jgi:hypothetical protein
MHVMEIQGTITPDRELRIPLPENFQASPGQHRVVVMVDDTQGRVTLMIDEVQGQGERRQELDLPLVDVKSWPANLSLRREDLYGDWGR